MRRLSLVFILAVACATEATPALAPGQPAPTGEAPTDDATAPPTTPPPDRLDLVAAYPRATLTEVYLDPRGEAAVIMDVDGSAYLWPDLRTERPAPPIVLPIVEAAATSFACAGERRYVVAAIDTAGGARVGQVDLGGARAQWEPLCEWTPLQATLELHVVDGGERLLRLGLDHSLGLHDRRGAELSRLDMPGFVPWQLRVAQTPGQSPKIAVVLVDPVRVQAVTLADDRLALAGDARRVALDQGPNHNDLLLSLDGTFVTAFRRPRVKGRGWTLELVDLATDARRWLAGEVDATVRPRVHLVDDTRVLLESGTGKGFWFDLGAAVVPPAGVPFDRAVLPRTPSARIDALPGSTEDSRMWSAVVAGVRVVADGEGLIVDPLVDDTHRRLAATPFRPSRVAIAPGGQAVAWYTDGVWTERPGEPASLRRVHASGESPIALEMIDQERVLVADSKGVVTLLRASDGAQLGSVAVAPPARIQGARYRPLDGARGELTIAVSRGRVASFVSVAVDGEQLGPPRDVAGWPTPVALSRRELQRLRDAVRAATGDHIEGFIGVDAGDRQYVLTRSPRERLYEVRQDGVRSLDLRLRDGGSRSFEPAPATARVAIVDELPGSYSAVHVIDFSGARPAVLWTRAFRGFGPVLRWSADGARLAVAGDGGWVLDAATGAVLHERHDRQDAGTPGERAPTP